MFICVYLYTHPFACTHKCEGQRSILYCFLNWSPPLVLKAWFVHWTWNDRLHSTDWPASPTFPSVSLPSQCWDYKNVPLSAVVLCVSWELNLGPHVCKASTLPTEPSLSPCSLNSFKILSSLNLYSVFHILIPLFPRGTLPSSTTIMGTKKTFSVNREKDGPPRIP